MQPVRQPARRQPRSRGGFTLIELLVVIVVIAILAAMLFPAISGAIKTAREATVVAEISTFDKSLVEFKNRYGVDVPSFIVLYEQGEAAGGTQNWGTDTSSPLPGTQDAYRRTSRAFIRQVWPDFDFVSLGDSAGNNSIDLNGDLDETDVLILNGSECLVFFLGGVFTRGANPAALIDDAIVGFAANPQNPFDNASTNNRVGPFFTSFLVDRFIDVDGDGMPEYRDGLSGQTRPYVYVSSYGGSGYKPFGLDSDPVAMTNPSTLDDEIPLETGSTTDHILDDAYRNDDNVPATPGPYLNLQSYQLISPGGDDFEFGVGGEYNGTGVGSARTNERDNITNFKGGRLN